MKDHHSGRNGAVHGLPCDAMRARGLAVMACLAIAFVITPAGPLPTLARGAFGDLGPKRHTRLFPHTRAVEAAEPPAHEPAVRVGGDVTQSHCVAAGFAGLADIIVS